MTKTILQHSLEHNFNHFLVAFAGPLSGNFFYSIGLLKHKLKATFWFQYLIPCVKTPVLAFVIPKVNQKVFRTGASQVIHSLKWLFTTPKRRK